MDKRGYNMKKFYKFPSIESFHHKVKAGKKYHVGPKEFNIKPKLHGTNAAIVYDPEEGVYAQSRKRVIDVENDNMGFAKFVDSLDTDIYNDSGNIIVIYGEWAGLGIQSKDAITQIGRKIFAPFAAMVMDKDGENVIDLMTNTNDVRNVVEAAGLSDHPDVIVIDTIDTIKIDFNGDEDTMKAVADKLNELIDVYEKVDTWVKDVFGVEGPGEGFVVTPQTNDYELFYNWSFKIKTDVHTVNKSSKSVVVKAEASKDALDFVDRFVTPARLQQAVSELGGEDEMDMKKMGEFLKWMGQDIKKESADELEASNLEWKDVSKLITNKSRMWFMTQYK